MTFAFAACGATTTPPDGGNNTTPESGEKISVEYSVYTFGGSPSAWAAPEDMLISSAEELTEYRKTHIKENAFGFNGYAEKLDSYSSHFFEDNMLVSIIRTLPNGGCRYNVKGMEAQDNTLTVSLQFRQDGGAVSTVCSLCGFLLECPKGDYTQLKIEVENKYQSWEVAGTYVTFVFTHEASLETIFHDYTPVDFPELDFDFTIEEFFTERRDEVRTLLSEDQTNDIVTRFVRLFEITLTETSKENMLRVIEALEAWEEVQEVNPAYHYFWPQE